VSEQAVRVALALPARTPAEQAADRVIATLRNAGFCAVRVGGAVRDRLLGRLPDEVDVATSARPEQVCDLFPHTLTVGARFGVVIVLIDEAPVEVATFRRDEGYSDGRRPDRVRFARMREDAARRDFTINALFYDPTEQVVYDFHGGLEDLRRGVIRAVGPPAARFSEDGLRLLRAVRFAAQFDFEIESSTASALVACRRMTEKVSPERVRDELTRMLTGPRPHLAVRLLADFGLLDGWLPEVSAMQGVPQPPEFHPEGDVWVHTLLMLQGLRGASPTLAWSVLLHDVGKPETIEERDGRLRFPGHASKSAEIARSILARLRSSRRLREDVAIIVDRHMQFADVGRMRPATLRRIMARPTFPDELELHRLDCAVSHRRFDNYCRILDVMIEMQQEPVLPPPLLRGRDLLKMGLRPGPLIGKILKEVETRQLNGELRSREEAIHWVRRFLAEKGESV